jgi:hypothetical protein
VTTSSAFSELRVQPSLISAFGPPISSAQFSAAPVFSFGTST